MKAAKPKQPTYNQGLAAAIRAAGSQEKLADALNVTPAAVCKWLHRSCPAERAIQVESATGIHRSIIRPDLFVEPAQGRK